MPIRAPFTPSRSWVGAAVLLAGFIVMLRLPHSGSINPYHLQILMYIGINIILTASLNLVNGYMGEFSVGHAGFMAVGAYISSLVSMRLIPWEWQGYLFPAALIAGGLAASLVGLCVAFPSFRTRGDYLAIVTLALNMIVKSVIENIEAVGGPRGLLGMMRLTSPAWVYVWVVITLAVIRSFVYSGYGRGVLSIREDEVAADIVGVDTRRIKLQAFLLSSFFAGIAGGLFAHLLQYINPASFNIVKSTEVLVMVYLGGIGSLTGSVLGATVYTVLLEALRFLGLWRWVVAPLMLVLLMVLRPTGIMGFRELSFFIPRDERWNRPGKGENVGAAESGRAQP